MPPLHKLKPSLIGGSQKSADCAGKPNQKRAARQNSKPMQVVNLLAKRGCLSL